MNNQTELNAAEVIITSFNIGQGNPVNVPLGKTPLLDCMRIDVEELSINDITLTPAQLLAFTAFHTWKIAGYKADDTALYNLSEHNALTPSHAQKILAGTTSNIRSTLAGHALTSIEYKAGKLKLLDDSQLSLIYDAMLASTAKGIVSVFEVISLEDREAVKNLEIKEEHERTKFLKLVNFENLQTLKDGTYRALVPLTVINPIGTLLENNFELASSNLTIVDGRMELFFKDKLTTI